MQRHVLKCETLGSWKARAVYTVAAMLVLASSELAMSAPGASSVSQLDEPAVGSARGELSTTMSDASWRQSKNTKFAYKLGSGFDSFANEREQAQYFNFGLNGDFRAQLMEGLTFRVKGGALLNTGYAQSRFGDNVGTSGIFMQEAVLSVRALETSFARVYAAAGAIDQSALEAPLLVSRQAFPGLKETLVIGNSKEFRLKLWAQQAIPTSKTLSTKTVDAEVTPSFLSETAELVIEPSEFFSAKASLTHYNFNNLPSAVALESVIYGNSVDEIGPNTSRFKYRFDGFMARGELGLKLAPGFGWMLSGYAIQNMGADEGYRNAQMIQTGFKIGLPGDIELSPSANTFFIEDDVVPGFYNSSSLGHNNRQGFGGALEAFFQRQRFKLRAEYVDAGVINYNVNQSRQQTLSLSFETFYEML